MISGRITVSAKASRVHLQRYLLGKLVFREPKFDLRDLCTLYENQITLERMVLVDENFRRKFGKSLEVLSILLQDVNVQRGLTKLMRKRFSKRIQQSLEEFYLPERNLQEASKKLNGLYQLLPPNSPGVPIKLLKPKRRIGIGYTDKGSARNPATQGTPPWQEVAVHRGPIYQGEGKNEKSKSTTNKGKIRGNRSTIVRGRRHD